MNVQQQRRNIKRWSAYITPKKLSQAWILFSIAALILAGFLSLFIMLGRTPVINEWLFDTLWMKRILVVHVNLALTVSFYAFIAGFFLVIPSSQNHANIRQLLSFGLALAATIILTISGFLPFGEPVLSNYIPVIDHPVFLGGLCLFGISLILTFFDQRLQLSFTRFPLSGSEQVPGFIIPILQASGIILIIAAVDFIHTWLATPAELASKTYYEFVLWGGGHVLQFTNMAAAVAVWGLLYYQITQKAFLSYRSSFILFGIYIFPLFFTPFLLIDGTTGQTYIIGFTRYMQWGIFPVVSVIILIIFTKMFQNRKQFGIRLLFSNPAFTGLSLSIFLTITGFILGAMIRGSNTMVPAHYHATLGAVTIAFMAGAYRLMIYYGYPEPSQNQKRDEAVQLLLFGIGQTIFVSGLAVAGSYGLARKVFGEEQLILSAEIYIGLGLLLIGGLTAIIGGILFLRNVLRYLRSK